MTWNDFLLYVKKHQLYDLPTKFKATEYENICIKQRIINMKRNRQDLYEFVICMVNIKEEDVQTSASTCYYFLFFRVATITKANPKREEPLIKKLDHIKQLTQYYMKAELFISKKNSLLHKMVLHSHQ